MDKNRVTISLRDDHYGESMGEPQWAVWFPIDTQKCTGITVICEEFEELLALAKKVFLPTGDYWTIEFDKDDHIVVELFISETQGPVLKGGFRSDRPLYEEFRVEMAEQLKQHPETVEQYRDQLDGLLEGLDNLQAEAKRTAKLSEQYHRFMADAIEGYKAANPQASHAEAFEHAREQWLGVQEVPAK